VSRWAWTSLAKHSLSVMGYCVEGLRCDGSWVDELFGRDAGAEALNPEGGAPFQMWAFSFLMLLASVSSD